MAQNQVQDIAPGSNKAILKLASGQRLVVTGAKNGLLVQQGNTTITKTADGQLTYNTTTGNSNGVLLYDTLIVPRGGQHQVKFADGSMAYLNADTRLRIPENFRGSDRTVELISAMSHYWYLTYPVVIVVMVIFYGVNTGAQCFAWRALTESETSDPVAAD